MSAPAKPTYLQSLLSTILLLCVLIVTAPVSFAVALLIRLLGGPKAQALHDKHATRVTVLVTGARTTKSLFLARTFWKAGYRVVMADEATWGWLAAARFSRCVSRYYNLADPLEDHAAYERDIRSIIRKEKVALWVCGSSAGATVNDAQVAQVVRTQDGVKAFIQSPREAEQLHNKDLFMDLCQQLGFQIPEGVLVKSIEETVDFLHSDDRKGRHFIIKTTSLDDQGRSDLTRLPFASREATVAHLKKMPQQITSKTPYVLQQFIDGYEYCTHCHAVDGVMQSFLASPSSDMLMRYVDCKSQYSARIADAAEKWTRDFLAKWKERLQAEGADFWLTGHFSFDFIIDKDGTMYPIECNPRIHTAAVLLNSVSSKDLAESYFGRKKKGLLMPPGEAKQAYSWMFHSIPLSLAQSVLARPIQQRLHPLLAPPPGVSGPPIPPVTASPLAGSTFSEVLASYWNGSEIDPMLDVMDPMPFAAQHITWLWLLTRLVFWQGKGWSRMNVSTSRIFTVGKS